MIRASIAVIAALLFTAIHPTSLIAAKKKTSSMKPAPMSKSELKPGQQEAEVPAELSKSQQLASKYLIYLPKDYETSRKQYPLMVFLHGRGESGENLNMVKKHGPPMLVGKKNKELPCIMISPQCKKGKWWNSGELMKLIEHVESITRVDSKRIYLTGLSMGGFGSWALAAQYPEKFAAVVPICGGGNPTKAKVMKDIPIWVFHGGKDTVVKIEKSQVMVDALKMHDSDVKFTIYPNAGHNSWTQTYNNQEVYDWMFKQKK